MLSEAKCKAEYEKRLKILSPKRILQRLPIALAKSKAGNAFENLLNGIRQVIYNFRIKQKKLLKSIDQYKELNKVIKQNGYYIYEFSLIKK